MILTSHARLELAALDLKEKHIENSLNVTPWKNLPSWLSHRKYVWAMARTNHREVEMLKSSLDVSPSMLSSDVVLTSGVLLVGDNQSQERPSSYGS